MVALLVVLTILIFLTIDFFVQRAELRRLSLADGVVAPRSPARQLTPLAIPEASGLHFTRNHTWFRREGAGQLRVGADGLPAAMLGVPARIDVVPAGTTVRAGDPVVTLHGGGRSLTLEAPVDGIVLSVNPDLAADPARLRDQPLRGGWIYRLWHDPDSPLPTDLLNGKRAAAWLGEELDRLRDRLAFLAGPEPAVVTLQDGGLPIEGLARHLPEESWKRLAESFFATPADTPPTPARFVDPFRTDDLVR